MVGIYKITNLVNGKIYIGQSTNIRARWGQHRTRPFRDNAEQYDSPLYRAIRKYGLKNFLFEVIEETSKDALNDREIYWISYYHSDDLDKGYNLTHGGGGSSVPLILTLEQVQEIRTALMDSSLSQAQIAEQYDVSQRTISSINLGQTWFDARYKYPLQSYREKPINEANYVCPICGGQKKTKTAATCEKCAHLRQRRVERPNREELKRLIRTTPFIRIGAMYGVSDTAIRKWCDKEGLPNKATEIKKMTDEEWLKV